MADVHLVLRQVVWQALESIACAPLERYTTLKREIAASAAAALSDMRGVYPHYSCELRAVAGTKTSHTTLKREIAGTAAAAL